MRAKQKYKWLALAGDCYYSPMANLEFTGDGQVFETAAQLFEQTKEQLEVLLPWADIQHVGATAVPGSITKGDLDIVVRVPNDRLGASDQILADLFERNTGSDRTSEFSAFEKKNSDPTLGVQLVGIGSENDCFHKWVRLLARDAELLEAYNRLKRDHAGGEMETYREAKSAFIQSHLRSNADG